MKTGRSVAFCLVLLLIILTVPSYGDNPVTILHRFTDNPDDRGGPSGRLTQSGSTLYGTTALGGPSYAGIIYSVNTDGSDYRVIYSFPGITTPNDGGVPYGGVILSGSTLYGTTDSGGIGDCWPQGCGVVFSVGTDGSNYKALHRFNGQDGAFPKEDLTLAGSTLYGTADVGGAYDYGVVFSIDTDGSNYKVLHSFPDSAQDGFVPVGSLTLSGSTLYGVTSSGGTSGGGTVFSLDTDGSNYKVLHSFSGGKGGAYPGGVVLSGSTLYGTTYWGGGRGCPDRSVSGCGAVFSMNADGTGYKVLHSFAGGTGDGSHPTGGLTLSGSTLYGVTSSGGGTGCLGKKGCGTIFSIDTRGSPYKVLTTFGQTAEDGRYPRASLTLSGHTLFGTTVGGGGTTCTNSDGCGTLFSFELPPETLPDLKIAKSGTGAGTVTGSSIDCGPTCSAAFIRGTTATLAAAPDTGSLFKGWSGGGCRGTGACTVTMKGDVKVTALFAKEQFTVRASGRGGHGRVGPAFRRVSYGGSASIALIPQRGFHAASVTDNGVSMPVTNPYVIEDVTSNHNVVVVFSSDRQ